jgi:hypothetical protein
LNKKLVALSLVLLLTTIYAASTVTSPVKAQSGGWITAYKIYDYHSNQLLVSYSPSTGIVNSSAVLPGDQVKAEITINIAAAGSGDLKLETNMGQIISGQFWALESGGNYSLGSDFSAGANPASFNWVQGSFTIDLYGTVPSPSNAVSTAPITIFQLYGPTSGIALDGITIQASSAAMTQFISLLQTKQGQVNSLRSQGVDSGYIAIWENIISAAQTTANNGNVADAIAMLNALDTSNAPMGSELSSLYIPLIVVFAVIAAIFAVMFMRARGKVSYFQLVVEDQVKDLEGLTMRAARVDRAMASNLDSIKDRLKRLVGM